MQRVLITGGAGFIGSHLADELLQHGYEVRVLDCFHSQVHGEEAGRPAYLAPEVELVSGDVRDAEAVRSALRNVDAVVHLAARVGVGQSMYEIEDYTSANNVGTSVLLESLIRSGVERLVVASSMSVYGEGLYRGSDGELVPDAIRSARQLRERRWEPLSPTGDALSPMPTSESKPPALASVYALSKYDQERLALMVGEAYDIPTVALRLFNVYGPRQALSNPYTGVLAVFACRLLNGKPPLIYEDGRQMRDFVNVSDVAFAFRLALEKRDVENTVVNVGSGRSVDVLEIARRLAAVLGRDIEPEVTGRYRSGDIRHCFADISKAEEELGYRPRVDLDEGMLALAGWLEGQIAVDKVAEASEALTSRGLAQ